ncbi:MAG TPA: SUMF1/EgtB/PvdO family nonheme iron enzyme, partial [Verrucomicrobiae bacterium]
MSHKDTISAEIALPKDSAMAFLEWVRKLVKKTFKSKPFPPNILSALRHKRGISDTLAREIARALFDRIESPEKDDDRQAVEALKNQFEELNGKSPFPGREAFETWFVERAVQKAAGNEESLTDDALINLYTGYLTAQAEHCAALVTRGINLPGVVDSLRLARVYVDLETTSPKLAESNEALGPAQQAKRAENLTALEVLFEECSKGDEIKKRVVLVGEPGSGKSTFFQYVTLCLAAQLSGTAAKSEIPHIPEIIAKQKLVPFRIILWEFAAELPDGTSGTSEDVVKYLRAKLEAESWTEASHHLTELLRRGLAFALFDGLDEVPRPKVEAVRNAIQAFAAGQHRECRIAVTCRVASYGKVKKKSAPSDPTQFEFRLASFPPEHRINILPDFLRKKFINAWYDELVERDTQFKKEEGAICQATLVDAIRREPLKEMAGNPFFLTAMAALHRPAKPLPNTAAELLDALVTGVIEESRKRGATAKEDARKLELAEILEQIPDGFRVLRLRMERLAFLTRKARANKGDRQVEDSLLRQNLFLTDDTTPEWVEKLIGALRDRAGLLHSLDGIHFEFAYRFEEFLAGCHLANDDPWPESEKSFHKRALRLWDDQRGDAQVAIVWAAGHLVHVGRRLDPVRGFVSALTPGSVAADGRTMANLELAADVARVTGIEKWSDMDVPDVTTTVKNLRERLVEMRDGSYAPPIRAMAGAAIGKLGDTRSGVGLGKDNFPDLNFRTELLPAGAFKCRNKKNKDNIKTPYLMSCYPVTVAQYQAFVDDKGYDCEDWWTNEGWTWRVEHDISGPEDYEATYQTPNHPRVGVSRHEAQAFCLWLSTKLKLVIRLPHEAEWEQAARWNATQSKADGRTYPWGESSTEELAEKCNCYQTGINHTSAVGLFPSGKAECGALDMTGNVWEWCENWYDEK